MTIYNLDNHKAPLPLIDMITALPYSIGVDLAAPGAQSYTLYGLWRRDHGGQAVCVDSDTDLTALCKRHGIDADSAGAEVIKL